MNLKVLEDTHRPGISLRNTWSNQNKSPCDNVAPEMIPCPCAGHEKHRISDDWRENWAKHFDDVVGHLLELGPSKIALKNWTTGTTMVTTRMLWLGAGSVSVDILQNSNMLETHTTESPEYIASWLAFYSYTFHFDFLVSFLP